MSAGAPLPYSHTDQNEPAVPGQRPWLHLGLFLLTVLTTTATGALQANEGKLLPLTSGLSFSLPLMAILTCHELGHYIAARLHRVPASLPFFIPLPPGIGLFGTMGAVITQGGGTRDRNKLIDIGAAGPLAGLVVAVPVLYYGLTLSPVKPLVGVGLQEGDSILYALLKYAAKGQWLPSGGQDVILHPTAWAGWAGLLVTMLNLLPIGQLDGGHVATAHFGNRYDKAARLLHQGLPWLALVAFGWVFRLVQDQAGGRELPGGLTPLAIAINACLVWFVWFAMLWVLGRMTGGLGHPPIDDKAPAVRGPQDPVLDRGDSLLADLHAGTPALQRRGISADQHDAEPVSPTFSHVIACPKCGRSRADGAKPAPVAGWCSPAGRPGRPTRLCRRRAGRPASMPRASGCGTAWWATGPPMPGTTPSSSTAPPPAAWQRPGGNTGSGWTPIPRTPSPPACRPASWAWWRPPWPRPAPVPPP